MSVRDRMIDYIEKKGGSCGYMKCPTSSGGDENEMLINPRIELPEETEVIFTLGGDGTMIRAAQATLGSKVPMAGINLGHLGYLCDLDETTVYPAIDELMEDNYTIEERMMLEGAVFEDDKAIMDFVPALNDIVITYYGALNVINISLYVDKKYLYSYNCDGMIFSTPTGSTAYNLSANGPIVDPKTQLILITPINPHTLNSRSIVIDSASEVELRVSSRYEGHHVKAQVLFDGNQRVILDDARSLKVRKASETTEIIGFSKLNFLERISVKLQER